MNFKPLDQLAKVIENAFSGVTKLRRNFKTFFIEAMILFIAIPKRDIADLFVTQSNKSHNFAV